LGSVGAAGDGERHDRWSEIKRHLHDWWQGYLPEDAPFAPPPTLDLATPARPQPDPAPHPDWSKDRLALVQLLWGEGFSSPGEAEHVLTLIKPLGLNPKMSVVDLNPGLGGTTRVIAKETGAWITAFEVDPDLAAAGQALSVKAGMAKKAEIRSFTPPRTELRPGSMDAVFAKESLNQIEDRKTLFRELYTVLKPQGQVLFTDYVLSKDGESSAKLGEWLARERPTPTLWTADKTAKTLREAGYDVRVNEDISAKLRQLVVAGWARYIGTLKPGAVDPAFGEAVIHEIELWSRRLSLIDSGEIACHRFHAFKIESQVR